MEIGSFIELELPKGREYYTESRFDSMQLVRLNTGRAAIWHAFRTTGCSRIWIPYYQCKTVSDFLYGKHIPVCFYHINERFEPLDLEPTASDAVLLVNYYGVLSDQRMLALSQPYAHPIIDNSQAFFAAPLDTAVNVYSARKFIGVPDGAYVIGRNAGAFYGEYAQGVSSDTALFLLQRIEYGCEGKAYLSRSANEKRIDEEDCLRMSKLTRALLDAAEYPDVMRKRRENFTTARALFDRKNRWNSLLYYSDACVPMIYPLLMEDDTLLERLIHAKHFQGRWWKWVEENPLANEFEKWVSRYILPITIDQRYGEQELRYIAGAI